MVNSICIKKGQAEIAEVRLALHLLDMDRRNINRSISISIKTTVMELITSSDFHPSDHDNEF